MKQVSISMVEIAIENAKFHGINLHHERFNPGKGDCVFEAIADNVSERICFPETFDKGPDHYRMKWLTDAEDYVLNFAGINEDEFRKEWNLLKKPQNYEYSLGDWILPAIAHCIRKDILIFNAHPDGAFDPIFVIEASKIGDRSPSTEIPVILAYNNVHYESLLPISKEDELKTVRLKKDYLSNNYMICKNDIPIFKYASMLSDVNVIDQDSRFQEKDMKAPKKIKDMTPQEKREYNKVKQRERREALSNGCKDILKERDRLDKAKKRRKDRATDERAFRKKRATERSNERRKAWSTERWHLRPKWLLKSHLKGLKQENWTRKH